MDLHPALSKVLVTGAGGQLGAELCRQLGSSALGLSRSDCDIADPAQVENMLQQHRPTAVINAAAYTQVDLAERNRDQCELVNTLAVAQLAECCQRLGCTLVQISTDYVFGAADRSGPPYQESDITGALGVYGESKRRAELAAMRCSRHFIIRTCGLYIEPIAGARPANFVQTMLRLAGERPLLKVVDDQHCTPSYVPDVARAIRFLLSTEAFGLYHVVNRGETTWFQFAREVLRFAGSSTPIEPITTAEYPTLATRPRYSVLDTSKYHALGGPPMPDWRDGLWRYFLRRQMGAQIATIEPSEFVHQSY